jgi:hypothetical protein
MPALSEKTPIMAIDVEKVAKSGEKWGKLWIIVLTGRLWRG